MANKVFFWLMILAGIMVIFALGASLYFNATKDDAHYPVEHTTAPAH